MHRSRPWRGYHHDVFLVIAIFHAAGLGLHAVERFSAFVKINLLGESARIAFGSACAALLLHWLARILWINAYDASSGRLRNI